MTEQHPSFDPPLDSYETRALALRTTVLQRIHEEGAPEDPLLLLIISSLARIPESAGDRVAVVVTDMVAGLRLSPQEWQKTHTSVAGVALAFDPEIQQFKDFFLEAAKNGAPRHTRAAWRAYLQGLIQLFENGTRGQPGERIGTNDLTAFIEGMPKCELHVHIEGTLEPEMKLRLARRNRVKLPYKNAKALKAAYAFNDLPSFLGAYDDGTRILLSEQDFFDVTYAYLTKAGSQNVRYTEMFFDPQAHSGRGVAFDTVIRGIRRAQLQAETAFGVRSQLMMCFLRDRSAELGMATLLESLPYKAWIIGVGLDSDEQNNPPVKFAQVFRRAQAEGYLLTMHCDVDQRQVVQYIWQAIRDIGVQRIDHGVNALEDPQLCEEIKRRSLALTVCLICNAHVSDSSKAEARHSFPWPQISPSIPITVPAEPEPGVSTSPPLLGRDLSRGGSVAHRF